MKGTTLQRFTLGSFAILALLAPSLHAQTTSCATITSSAGSVPAGFGVPYNVLSSAKENLIDAQCNGSTGGATINIGSGGSNQYIYNHGYVYKNNQWTPITYSAGTGGGTAGVWITAKAKTNLTASQLMSTGVTYLVAYVCQKVGTTWKCGCRDSACATGMWQLQTIQPPQPPTISTPVSTNALENAKIGYSLLYPDEWQVTGQVAGTEFANGSQCESVLVVDFKAPAGSGIAVGTLRSFVQICAKPLSDSLTLDDFMRQTYGNNLTSWFQITSLAGMQAYRTTGTSQNTTSMWFLQTKQYRIQIVAAVGTWPYKQDIRVSQVQQILASLSFQ